MNSNFERKQIRIGARENITGNPEQDLMMAALRALEIREGERRGWDQNPVLYLLHLLDMNTMEVRIFPQRRWKHGDGSPVESIMRQAQSAAHQTLLTQPKPLKPLAFQDSPDGLAGVGFMFEAWAVPNSKLSEEEKLRLGWGERVASNSPHRVEVRQLFAADINGIGYTVVRSNGQKTAHVSVQKPDGSTVTASDSNTAMFGVTPEEAEGTTGALFTGRTVNAVMGLAIAARYGVWPFDPLKFPGNMVPPVPQSGSRFHQPPG